MISISINGTVGTSKVIFVLRSPADRLISFFRYHKAQVNLPKSTSIEEYIQQCLDMPSDKRCLQENDAYWGIEGGGKYGNYFPDWYFFFKNNIKFICFEDLAKYPVAMLQELSGWLGISPLPFEELSTDVEKNRYV